MKISWIRIAIVVITLFLFLSLIFLHNTSIYHNEDHSSSHKISRNQFNPIGIYDSSKYDTKQINIVNSNNKDKIDTTSIIPENNQDSLSKDSSTSITTHETSDSIDQHNIELPLKSFIEQSNENMNNSIKNSTIELVNNNNNNNKDNISINEDKIQHDIIDNFINPFVDVVVKDNTNVFNLLKQIQIPLIEQYVLQLKSKGDLYIPYLKDDKSIDKEFQFNILDHFHKSLKYGSIYNKNEETKNMLSKNSLYQSIERLISKVSINTIIEYDYEHIDIAYSISYALAKSNPLLTAILLRYKSMKDNDITHSNNDVVATGSNIFVSHILSNNNNKNDHYLLGQQFNCIQIISDLDLLVHNLLPFEYEMSLATILCRCNITYIPNKLPQMNSYFAFWDSVTHLIESVQVVAKELCAWAVVVSAMSDNQLQIPSSSIPYISMVKYSHIILQRNHTTLQHHQQQAQSPDIYRNHKSNEVTTSSSSKGAIKYNSHIPVNVLLNLPLDATSKQVLWSSLLNYLLVLDLPSSFISSISSNILDDVWLDHLVMRGSIVCNVSDIVDNIETIARFNALPTAMSSSSSSSSNTASSIVNNNNTSSYSYLVNSVKKYSKYHYVNGVLKKEPLEINTLKSSGLENNKSIPTINSRRLSSSTYGSSSSSSSGYSSKYKTVSSIINNVEDSLPDLYDNTVSWYISDTQEEQEKEVRPPIVAVTDVVVAPQEEEYDSEINQYIISELSKKSSTTYIAKSNLDRSSAKYYSRSSPSFSDKSASNVKYTVSSLSRTLQRHLYLREEKYYQRLLKILEDDNDNNEKKGSIPPMNIKKTILDSMKKSNIIYIMGKHISLFSLKLSKLLSTSTSQDDTVINNNKRRYPLVVSLLSDSLSTKSHLILTNVMELKNNMITLPHWNHLDFILGLITTPERGDYSIIQVDVLIAVITSVLARDDYANLLDTKDINDNICITKALLLEQSISVLLSLSTITYIEVPSLDLLTNIFQSVLTKTSTSQSSCVLELNERYIRKNLLEMSLLQLQFNTIVDIHIMNNNDYIKHTTTINTYKVKIQYIQQEQDNNHNYNNNIKRGVMNNIFKSKHSEYGLSLYTALHMGIIKQQKKLLLKMLINFPLWRINNALNNITSWNIFIQMTTSIKSKVFKKPKLSWSITYQHNNDDNNNNINNNINNKRSTTSQEIKQHINAIHSRNHESYTEQLRQEVPPLSVNELVNNNNINNNNRKLLKENDGVLFRANEVDDSPKIDRKQGQILWKLIEHEFYSHKAELAEGKFSFIDHNSGYGYLSLRISKEYPNATVISLEKDAIKAGHHVSMIKSLNIHNNAVCLKVDSDDVIHKNIYESPELFRFQILSNSLLDSFIHSYSLSDWGQIIGTVLSTSLTTFIYTPLANQVSWAMFLLFGEVYDFGLQEIPEQGPSQVGVFTKYYLEKPFRFIEDVLDYSILKDSNHQYSKNINMIYELNYINKHPQYPYADFEGRWLLDAAVVNGGQTSVLISPLTITNKPVEVVSEEVEEKDGLHWSMFPLVRCDIVNMTRHVHHHYEYNKDGHTRTYTMEVIVNHTLSDYVREHLGDASQAYYTRNTRNSGLLQASSRDIGTGTGGVILKTEQGDIKHIYSMAIVAEDNLEENVVKPIIVNNISTSHHIHDAYVLPGGGVLLPLGYHPNQHNIVGVHLHRDKDSFPIPYTSIYGVTLITTLRLGLERSLRDELFKSFLSMSLYEDMAPWNIVLMGPKLDYIDYDTKEFTFNDVIPKAYQIMTVLMNYKRTVEDFQRCGSKSPTIYGLPYVSDCVGTNTDRSLTCPDLKLPVPCADGLCHTDYISCLQAITEQASVLNEGKNNKNYNTNQKLINDINKYRNSYIDNHFIAAMKSIIGDFDQNQSITKSME